jgi:hypothetical protein
MTPGCLAKLSLLVSVARELDKNCPGLRLGKPGSPHLIFRSIGCVYGRAVVRPESWPRLAGGSPVPVGTGVPGSRPRFVGEIWRAKRGVESLFGGSKCAGRSVTRTLQPRQTHNGRAEPLTSRRRPCLVNPGPGSVRRVSPGYGRRHVHIVWAGTGEARLPGLRRAKTRGISRW